MATAEDVSRVLASTNHYQTLGIGFDAKATDVSKAYRNLSKTLHPDKNPSSQASDAFRKLVTAHDVLADPLQRRTYDRENLHALQGVREQQQQYQQQRENESSFRANSGQHAPWQESVQRVPKPVWQSPEELAMQEKRLAEMETNDLRLQVAQLTRDLHDERRAAKERNAKHETELTVQKRLTSESKRENDKIKDSWRMRLEEEKQRHNRETQELHARVALLEVEVAALKAPTSSRRCGGGSDGGSSSSGSRSSANDRYGSLGTPSGAPIGATAVDIGEALVGPQAKPATTRSIEKDANGNFVVVERDASGGYTVSAERLAAERHNQVSTSNGVVGPVPKASSTTVSEALAALLLRLGLDRFIAALEEEELVDLPLLRSMGPMLTANMRELGMTPEEAHKLKVALGL